LARDSPREEFARVLGQYEPQCNYYLGEDGIPLWRFTAFLSLGHEVALGAAERRGYFGTKPALRQARKSIDGPKIVDFLNSSPSASVRQITITITVPRPTVFDYFRRWNYRIRHVKWAPHDFTAAMMEQRVELSKKLLVTMRTAKHCDWTH
jgi:hypothetical protein